MKLLSWPLPFDEAAAGRLLERFSALGRAEARIAATANGGAILRCLGGDSPYLSDLAVRESATILRFVAEGPDATAATAMAVLAETRPSTRRDRVAAALRQAKRQVALICALADIGGQWKLEQVTEALSALAEATLSLAVAHLLRAAHDAGELMLPDPENPAAGGGFTVLGMGKLGARELNYSSDVDLVLLFDPTAPIYTERTAGHAMTGFAARIARGLVSLMETRDADGYVFRTDLRLRPDPAATPPAIAMTNAITYYESMGQNWERAAMIKARPVAGDLDLGTTFLEAIRPFVWRRGLDFAAVADIQAMKRRIDQHKGGALGAGADPAARIAGHNVKLGEGGIREIEFLVQTLQLVWGGRDPGLRDRTTLGALRLLTKAGHIPRQAARELSGAYRFLRQVEHRLQMVNDRQTHVLPEKPDELTRIALFLGLPDAASFARKLIHQLARVRTQYRAVFEVLPSPLYETSAGPELDFRGDDPSPPATIAALKALGFGTPERIVARVRAWQTGHVRALRSARARDLMDQMLPTILARIGRQPHPDETFTRFDRFISAQPAGVQLLSLFQRNPMLMDRIAAVLGASPQLADHLATNAMALEGLLSPAEEDAPSTLRRRLGDARGLEEAIELTSRAVKEEDFAISVATMEGRLDVNEAGLRRTAMADAALTALLTPVLGDFTARFGRVRGGGMAVVALGKAGGREMMAGSDLDLMFIYDHPPGVAESQAAKGSGARGLPASQWFVRLAHAYIAALTSPGVEGHLYDVDMRLRPSGNKGPVAVSLEGFRRYHEHDAWTWERMSLTRARVIAGPPALRARVASAIATAIAGDASTVRADAAAMRTRMLRDLPPDGPWDVKARPGGQIEVEFVAQVLQLRHAEDLPGVLSPTTREALRLLGEAGAARKSDMEMLIRADHTWRTVQGMLRITVGRDAGETLPDASARPLLRAMGAADLPALRAVLDALAAEVRGAFARYVGVAGQ
ncbi:MAG: bifunctional [glutamine synthetase] adenylyltransferase/[glutamine synthetase]-adenylyl-L-tyrosine phosphorylase [Acetobacteraceae bacterium]|nr:bifunctional [glutamine synthetase] adenylyltransferase/[glutamine synthetase]-adenylyl-L-tyrosine phosphorylase [Acetobacteraceae bacterium]